MRWYGKRRRNSSTEASIGPAVVGHDTLFTREMCCALKIDERAIEEGHGAGTAIVAEDLDVAIAAVLVDRIVGALVASGPHLERATAVDLMAHATDARNFLGVDVDELSRLIAKCPSSTNR